MHTKTTKRERWEQIIAEWETSGLSQKAFCQKHGLSHYLFTYWRKITRDHDAQPGQEASDTSGPAIQLACYQIGVPSRAIDPDPEFETQGITIPIGDSGSVTITGRLTIGQLAKIMAACGTAEPGTAYEKGASDVPA